MKQKTTDRHTSLKICLVSDCYPPRIGGAEMVVKNIAEGIAARGSECIVITSRKKGEIITDEHPPGLKVKALKVPGFISRFWFLVLALPVIIRFARGTDVIQGTSYGGALPAWIAAKLTGKKVILTVHEFMGERWKKFESSFLKARFYILAEKILVRLNFDRFTTVSNYTKETLIKLGCKPDKIDVIYNGPGAELKQRREPEKVRKELGMEGRFLFTAYGRAGITKGMEYLAEAVPEVLNEVGRSAFILILKKDDKRIWRKIKDSLRDYDERRVKLMPPMPYHQLEEIINAADCVVIPSLSEGFGFTVQEACAAGKKGVETKAGAVPEVIYGKYLLAEPADSASLAECCIKIIENDIEYKEGKDFSWDKALNEYFDAYNKVIEKR